MSRILCFGFGRGAFWEDGVYGCFWERGLRVLGLVEGFGFGEYFFLFRVMGTGG